MRVTRLKCSSKDGLIINILPPPQVSESGSAPAGLTACPSPCSSLQTPLPHLPSRAQAFPRILGLTIQL